jgi:hypothetical protein
MLYKCANKTCNTPFRRLREGKLFQVETEYLDERGSVNARRAKQLHRVEHYWLCDSCSPFVTLTFDQGKGVITVPLPNGLGKKTVKMIPVQAAAAIQEAEEESMQQTLAEVLK